MPPCIGFLIDIFLLIVPKKNRHLPFGADNGFYFFNDDVRPLSTPFLAAGNETDDEYENKANKVVNGEIVMHGFFVYF